MSDPSLAETTVADSATNQLDELIEEVRASHASGATLEQRYATAVKVNRSLLGVPGLQGPRNAAPAGTPTPTPSAAAPQVEALIKAIATVPREQLVAVASTLAVPVIQLVASHVRPMLAPSRPVYLSRPATAPASTAQPVTGSPPYVVKKP